uniref:protein xylosyltransferase n=1 Tax=Alexandrium monilatum TaxID=311494 RepID=A0A7S4QXL4_9DINO
MDRLVALALAVSVATVTCQPVRKAEEEMARVFWESDTLSLIQMGYAPTIRASSSRTGQEAQLLAYLSRTWFDDPLLRQRLVDLLHSRGQDAAVLNKSMAEAALHGPLKNEAEQIIKEEIVWRRNVTLTVTQEELQPQTAGTLHEEAEEGAEGRLHEEAAKKQRLEAERQVVQEEATRVAAEESAKKAEAERQHWQGVAAEAKRKAEAALEVEAAVEASMRQAKREAEEELKVEAVAEESMRQAAVEEARYQALEREAAQTEQRMREEERRAEDAEAARQKAAAEAAEAALQAEAEAQQRAKAAAEAEAAAKEAARLKAEEASLAKRLRDKSEVESILNTWEQARVCVRPHELGSTLQDCKKEVLSGLPEWNEPEVPGKVDDVVLAFLIQASWEEQLPVLRRTFDRLYSDKDLFLYTVDRERLAMSKVIDALPSPLPANVVVQPSAHSPYFVWPRVEIVLDGLRSLLLNQKKWDFAIHLSESDYPVHNLNWIRQALALQRNTNFIQIIPRCWEDSDIGLLRKRDQWYWWSQDDALASCGSEIDITPVGGVKFPMGEIEDKGFRFAHGAEWMAVTREFVKYALSPKLLPYRKLVGMHVGADEIFWQTLVLNIPNFKQNVSQQGWYIKWGHGKTDHSPDTLTESYQDDILKNRRNLFFVRKVSQQDSSSLLDAMDGVSERDETVPGPGMFLEDKSAKVVPCSSGRSYIEVESNVDEDFMESRGQEYYVKKAPPTSRNWKGTKSRKQLLEAYKWYMENQ